MGIVFFVYEGLTALDLFGPHEVLARLPGVDVLVVPGGMEGTFAAAIAGDDTAKALQPAIEYDPNPPFDCGSPEKAPPELVELVASLSGSASI